MVKDNKEIKTPEISKCKNCGREIVKVVNRWYHTDDSKRHCSTKVGEPI